MGDGTKLTRDAYEKLIVEDLTWLNAQPRSLEREHIAMILRWSVGALYGWRVTASETVEQPPERKP